MLAFIGIWLLIVVGTTIVMARLGHSWFTWAVLSMALGPLSWPLAIGAERTRRQLTPSVAPHPGHALVAFGRPADELARLAERGGYDVIVLGPSGPRTHHVLHGHVASQLRRRTSIPLVRGSLAASVG